LAELMWWLPIVDGPIPVGDIVYGLMVAIEAAIAIDDALANSSSARNQGTNKEISSTAGGGAMPNGSKPPRNHKRENVEKKIDALYKKLTEHYQKLIEYKLNPDAYDNRQFLKNAATLQQRESIINGRIHHLQTEIDNFTKQLVELLNSLTK